MNTRAWSRFFVAAALFNFLMGAPIFFAPAWSHRLAYVGEGQAAVLRFWSDFGFAVLLIGYGYWMVSRDVTRNRGLVWLGVFAKLFDVVVLTWRWAHGDARPVVLLPAAIDGAFMVFFIVFLRSTRSHARSQATS